jgi:micrococcal nuclease
MLLFETLSCNRSSSVTKGSIRDNMTQKQLITLVSFLILLIGGFFSGKVLPSTTPASQPAAATHSTSQKIQFATTTTDAGFFDIERVVDGDTVVIKQGSANETVRLIGLNTPETVDPRKAVQCFGKEASDKAKATLTGQRVRIELDPTQGLYDKYGRLLAYVWLEDGTLFNKYMISEGYGYEYTYNTPYKYQKDFKAAQKAAELAQKGLWAPGVCQ